MTIRNFYYDIGNGAVRVEAESYTQVTEYSRGGHCSGVRYRVSFTQNWVFTQFGSGGGPGRLGAAFRTLDVTGPVDGPLHRFENRAAYATIYVGPNQAPITWSALSGRRTVVTDSRPPTDISIVALEEEPEHCQPGEFCQTRFFIEGQVVHQLNECPAVSEEPPEPPGCPCCSELLPIAQRIQV